jgi:predicted amino acid racemase
MAIVRMYRERLKHNYQFLDDLFKQNKIDWAVVTKLLCGNELYLKEVLSLGVKEVCDSRLKNLKKLKQLDPNIQTVYIKPPAKRSIKNVVKYADVSFNTESKTIELLSKEAVRQNKIHKITIMIELGDLREGIMGENLITFYDKVFNLPNIEITSIGANLNCLHGVMPSQDKLIQLGLYKQLIDIKFEKQIPWISGGTSVVVPLLFTKQVPPMINHFRVGEALFFGNNLFNEESIPGMKSDVFKLFAEIIEITEKPKIPIGTMAENPSGDVYEVDESDYGKTTFRAIIDVGLLDISPDYLIPEDPDIEIINASSDMLVLDLGESKEKYKVGELLSFQLKYMGVLRLLSSDYIEKQLV